MDQLRAFIVWRASTWIALFAPCLLQAQDSLMIRTNYYQVRGSSLREIRQSIDKSRPRTESEPHDGLTIWRIDWQVRLTQQNNVCRLTSFTTRTTVTITLPLWVFPTNDAPVDLIKTWRDYITALGAHEQGHAQFAKAASVEMHRQVNAIGQRSDCAALRNEVNEVARRILENYRQKEKEYDAKTRHGATQGAILPWAATNRPRGRDAGVSGTNARSPQQ